MSDEGGDAVGGIFAAGFKEPPTFVGRFDKELGELLPGVPWGVEFADVGGESEALPDEVEIGIQAAVEVGVIGVPADGDVGVRGDIHDLFDDGEFGAAAVDFESDLLVVVGGEVAEGVEGRADLFDGFGGFDAFWEVIGSDLDAGGSDVGGEFDEGLGIFDVFGEFSGVWGMEVFGGADADEADWAVGELFFDFGSLDGVEVWFDFVGMGGAEFDAEEFGGGAIADEGWDVPIAAPLIGDEAEPDGWRAVCGRRGGFGEDSGRRDCERLLNEGSPG